MRKLSLFTVLLIAPLFLSAQQPAFVTDSLDKYIAREMKAWNLPGMAVAIVKDGKVVVSKGYGIREIGKFATVNDSTLFQIASCTKAFTATSIAMLDAQKKLSLDDTIRKWMPNFSLYDPNATHLVTIRDLLCHRIGLQTFQGDFLNWNSNLSRSEIIAGIARNKPVFGFRAGFGYCNAAFLTAGEIIPIVTGTSWDDFVKTNFFIPLAMTRTSTQYKLLTADKNACKPHTRWDGKEEIIPYDNIDNLGPAGSVNSCVKDLSHWIMMQLDSGRFNGKQIVPWEALQKTRQSQTIVGGNSATHFITYGMGWFTTDYNGKQIFWHTGGASGFLSLVCFVPELNLGFVILTNDDNNNLFSAMRPQLLDAYLNLPYKNYSAFYHARFMQGQNESDDDIKMWKTKVAQKPKLPVDAKLFAGKYSNPVYGEMNVTSMDGKIGATFQHHPTMFAKLEYMGDSIFLCTFNSPLWGIKQAPFKIENGKVTAITISVNEEVDAMSYIFRKE